MYEIEFTPEALEDLRSFRKFEQNEIMTVITVPVEDNKLNELLKQAQQNGLILEAANGQRFMLVSLEEWAGFEVGEEEDFEREVELTGQNQELMEFLGKRRSQGKRIPLAEVKEQLGLE